MAIPTHWRRGVGAAFLAATAATLVACGGGSGNKDSFSVGVTVEQLSGTWTGSLEDSGGVLHTLSVTIAAGSVTQVLVDGGDLAQTGTVTKASDALFSVVLGSAETRLFIDTTATHAVFVDENFNFGVIEKDAAAPLPVYTLDDSNGDWAGRTLTTDFSAYTVFASSGACLNQTCSNVGNGVTASMDLSGPFDGVVGNWTGTYSIVSPTESGDVSLLMSDDMNFVGFYQCPTTALSVSDCRFSAWVRQ